MSQLAANQVNIYESFPLELNSQQVADNVIIWKGSAVGSLSGYARQLVANDLFMGFAEQHIDNTVTGHVVGGVNVPVIRSGVIQAAITNAAVTDINKAVYMSDGATFTYTSGGNTLIGRVIRFVSAGVVMVQFSITNQAAS